MDPTRALLDRPPGDRRVGPFRLIEQLGRGGFAPVWLAEETYGDTALRTAAVKLFSLEIGGASTRAQIIEEARALCQVEHPNVVRFYALPIDEELGLAGLAMEYVAGPPLDRSLAAEGTLDLATVLAVGVAIASALAAVHRAGLVHRDVKPANVVECGGVYKLIDFGIAAAEAPQRPRPSRAVLPDEIALGPGSRMTALDLLATGPPRTDALGFFSGTVGYVDPEHFAHGGAASAASDLYSLGATVFECLTGVLPAASSAGRLRGDVLDGRAYPRSLGEALPGAAESLVSLVDSLLQPRAEDRPPSAEWAARRFQELAVELTASQREAPSMRVAGQLERHRGESDRETGASTDAAVATAPINARPARAAKRSTLLAAGLILAIGATALVIRRSTESASATSTAGAIAPMTSASVSARHTVLDHPRPASSNEAAVAAFYDGLRAVRDANADAASRLFDRAAELDPTMPEAAAYRVFYGTNGDLRPRFTAAMLLRDRLSERDTVLLGARSPVHGWMGYSYEEMTRRVAEAAERFPDDPEIVWFAGVKAANLGRHDEAQAFFLRSLALDPAFAQPMHSRARLFSQLGRAAEARAALEECARVSPASPDCLEDLALFEDGEGLCSDMEQTTLRGLARSPAHRALGEYRAAASLAIGDVVENVPELLRAVHAAMTPEDRRQRELLDPPRLAALAGRFDEARQGALSAEKEARADREPDLHTLALRLAFEAALETANAPEASRIAERYIEQSVTWVGGEDADESLLLGTNALLFGYAFETGKLPRERFERLLADYVQWTPEGWAEGHGAVAHIDGYAARALATMSPERQRPPYWMFPTRHAIGVILAAAGRHAEAAPLFRAYAASCHALFDPIRHTRASLLLGRALERSGDPAGACVAYRKVVTRWAKATPRSVSAEEAAARVRALRCELSAGR